MPLLETRGDYEFSHNLLAKLKALGDHLGVVGTEMTKLNASLEKIAKSLESQEVEPP